MMMMMTRKIATDGVETWGEISSLPRGGDDAEMADKKTPLMALERRVDDAVTTRKERRKMAEK